MRVIHESLIDALKSVGVEVHTHKVNGSWRVYTTARMHASKKKECPYRFGEDFTEFDVRHNPNVLKWLSMTYGVYKVTGYALV